MTKLIPRYQNPSSPLVMRGDNTRILIPINPKLKYKALTWKERVLRTFPELPVIRSDNRSSYLKALDRRTGVGALNILKDKKAASQLMTAIDYTMPSHLIQGVANAVTNSDAENHGIFGENGILFQGDSPFTVAGNLATDFVVAPWAVSKFSKLRPVYNTTLFSKTGPYDATVNLNPDGTWNMNKIVLEIKKGAHDALEFLGSDIHKATNEYNTKLAHRLGYTHYEPYAKAKERSSTPVSIDLVSLTKPNNPVKGNVEVSPYGPTYDKMRLNLYGNINNSAFHETLHRGYFGTADGSAWNGIEPYKAWRQKFHDSKAFSEWKTDKLLVPRTAENYETLDYLSLFEGLEAAANGLEIGRELGIKPGTPFPGKKKALEIFDSYSKSSAPKSGIFNGLKWRDKPKRIWDLLTGRYLMLPLGFGISNTVNQNNL